MYGRILCPSDGSDRAVAAVGLASRLATLLPEIGTEVARAHEEQSRQFKITVERPAGASGELNNVSMGTRGAFAVTSVSLGGRVI